MTRRAGRRRPLPVLHLPDLLFGAGALLVVWGCWLLMGAPLLVILGGGLLMRAAISLTRKENT